MTHVLVQAPESCTWFAGIKNILQDINDRKIGQYLEKGFMVYVGFLVLQAVSGRNIISYDVMPFSLAEDHLHFIRMYCLQNVTEFLLNYVVSHPRT
jgi:hypothetical protein